MDWRKRFSISLFILVAREVLSCTGEATCNAPSVTKGTSAKITCSFDKNTPRMEKNVFLEHLMFNAYDHEIVVSCQLIEGRYVCICNDGYQVLGTVDDKLTVEIPNTLEKHLGSYWCGGFDPRPLERIHCKLNFMDNVNVNDHFQDGSNNKLSQTENVYEQGKITEDDMPPSTVNVIIPVTIATVFAGILVITIFVIMRRRARKAVHNDFTKGEEFLQTNIYVGDENNLTNIQHS